MLYVDLYQIEFQWIDFHTDVNSRSYLTSKRKDKNSTGTYEASLCVDTQSKLFEAPATAPATALPLVAIGALLAGLVLLTAFAGPLGAWLDDAAAQLYQPGHYIDAVLGAAGENE